MISPLVASPILMTIAANARAAVAPSRYATWLRERLKGIHTARSKTREARGAQTVHSCLARQSDAILSNLGHSSAQIMRLRSDAARDACACPWC